MTSKKWLNGPDCCSFWIVVFFLPHLCRAKEPRIEIIIILLSSLKHEPNSFSIHIHHGVPTQVYSIQGTFVRSFFFRSLRDKARRLGRGLRLLLPTTTTTTAALFCCVDTLTHNGHITCSLARFLQGRECHILLQNENGPCPLLAAANCL